MNQLQKDFDAALKRDCIAQAEKLLGVSYKECDAVTLAGISLMHEANEVKKAHAVLTRDTYWCMPWREYIAVIESMGFKRILHEQFEAEHCGSVTKGELLIYWMAEKGILLKFDLYGETGGINGGDFYYAIKPKKWQDLTGRTSSGRMSGDCWVGSHDCREAIRHHIDVLSEVGEFQAQWPEMQWLWLLHWADTKPKGYNYEEINRKRIAQFPAEVQKAICFIP